MPKPSTITDRRATWAGHLARERRQLTEAKDRNDKRAAAEHERQIGILECLIAELDRAYRIEPGGAVQTTMTLPLDVA
jgi:hypothetical protein